MIVVLLKSPNIDKQKEIVEAYEVIENRIELKRKININLREACEGLKISVGRAFADIDGKHKKAVRIWMSF